MLEMITMEFHIVTLVDCLKRHRLHVSAIIVMLFLILPRGIQVMISIACVAFGAASTFYLMRDTEHLQNLFHKLERKKKRWQKDGDEFSILKKKCPVCGKQNCDRHRPELNFVALQPWTNLKVPEKFDDAVEELLNLVLKEHVYTWYREVSEDEAFVDEIRTSLRFVAAVALRRLSKIDIPQFIQIKILRTLIRHLHFYLEVKRKAPPGADIEQAVLDHYGRHLHVAARNRKAELEYLGNVVNQLFPLCLHRHALKCKSLCILLRELLSAAVILPAMDTLAEPDIVNLILILLFDDTPPIVCSDAPSAPVNILANFNKPLCQTQTKLNITIAEILADPDTLFPFMQFMKAEAAVNVLQFYLTVEEFNNKILTPELSDKDMAQLHEEVQQLYRMYISPASVDTIHFEPDIVHQIQTVCDGPPQSVLQLQRTTPLFRAYDHAYELLNHTFLPLFHQSDDYYMFLCGERIRCKLQRSGSRVNKGGTGSITSKIGSKIKGVFKTPPNEGGKIDNNIEHNTADGKMDVEFAGGVGYRSLQYKLWEDGPLRDLSAWRVTIPNVAAEPDPDNPRRSVFSFLIEVRRIDVVEDDFEPSKWVVQRLYSGFYALEQKLKEFHGDFEGIELPAKRVFGTKNYDYLESKRTAFQTYLQRLLTLPNLKGSELLYHFLTSDLEMASSFLPDINLSKLVKTGALKLVKERGQHLEPFLESFLKSTESLKPIPSRWTDKDSDTTSISSEKMLNSVFDNNADKDLVLTQNTLLHLNLNSIDYVPVEGATDMIMYLMDNVYVCKRWFHNVLLALRFLFRGTLDTLFDWFLGKQMNKLALDYRAEKLTHQVRDVLFFDMDPPRTDEEKQKRKDKAFHCLQGIFPKAFVWGLGSERHTEGTQLMFEVLQKPRLNKQLSYMLLDEVLREAFPEFLSNLKTQSTTNLPFKQPH